MEQHRVSARAAGGGSATDTRAAFMRIHLHVTQENVRSSAAREILMPALHRRHLASRPEAAQQPEPRSGSH